jgi:hypothetical protein
MCAGPVLAAGRLPAKHIANVVVSLAKQRQLSPDLAAVARALLERDLDSCNGQDVSQILYGLMLDRAVSPQTADTFSAIAPQLAAALRNHSSFQAQAVSRILSSYAKVGCFAPALFEAALRRLSTSLQVSLPRLGPLPGSTAGAGL